MAKRLTVLALRLMLLNLVSTIIYFITAVAWDNAIFQLVINCILTLTLLYFVWNDSSNTGQKDIQKDKIILRKMSEENYVPSGNEGKMYTKWFGYMAGLLTQTPALIVIVFLCFLDTESLAYQIMIPLTRAWFITYSQIYINFESALPYLFFIFPIIFTLVSGLAYTTGPAKQKRLEVIIERNNAKKAKRVQDEKKNKKKGNHNKNSIYRR